MVSTNKHLSKESKITTCWESIGWPSFISGKMNGGFTTNQACAKIMAILAKIADSFNQGVGMNVS